MSDLTDHIYGRGPNRWEWEVYDGIRLVASGTVDGARSKAARAIYDAKAAFEIFR